jgi:uncharacterized membrane protein
MHWMTVNLLWLLRFVVGFIALAASVERFTAGSLIVGTAFLAIAVGFFARAVVCYRKRPHRLA